MAPWVSATGWVRVRSTDLFGFNDEDNWFAMRPLLNVQAAALAGDLQDLVEDLLEHFHHQQDAEHLLPVLQLEMLASEYALCMELNDPAAIYIHVGPYSPASTERFSISKLRHAPAAGVKPLGVPSGTPDTWTNGVLSAAQEEVMQRALDFMAEVVGEVQADQGVLGGLMLVGLDGVVDDEAEMGEEGEMGMALDDALDEEEEEEEEEE